MAKTTFKDLVKNLKRGQVTTAPPGNVVPAGETRRSIQAPLTPHALRILGDIQNSGLDDGMQAVPLPEIPRTPENLPVVISRALDTGAVHPRWHQVKNLPGYMSTPIRAMGRMIFSHITKTPIEEIQVLSSLTNRPRELAYMGDWIIKNGHKNAEMTIRLANLVRGYSAEVDVWDVEGYRFAVVADMMGTYIYGWPV